MTQERKQSVRPTKEAIQMQLNQAKSLPQLDATLNSILINIRSKSHTGSILGLYQSIAAILPLPEEINQFQQQMALDGAKSTDLSVQQMGRRVFTYLNLTTIISAINPYLTENDMDNDEIVQRAVIGVYERVDILTLKRVSEIAKKEAVTYLAVQNDIPKLWVEEEPKNGILKTIDESLMRNSSGLDEKAIRELVTELNRETGFSSRALERVIRDRNAVFLGGKQMSLNDVTSSAVMATLFVDEIGVALGSNSMKQVIRKGANDQLDVLKGLYNLDGAGEGRTQREVGEELGIREGRVIQLEQAAFTKLHDRTRSERLGSYLVD